MAGTPAPEPPKTNSALPVPAEEINQSPYAFNVRLRTRDAEGDDLTGAHLEDKDKDSTSSSSSEGSVGSGVIAGDPKLIFSTAHIFYERGHLWVGPPQVFGPFSLENPPDPRGYFRWSNYSDNVIANTAEGQNGILALSRDTVLIWGISPFMPGAGATVDFNGYKKLKSNKVTSMLTGYPFEIAYTEMPVPGMQLHATAPAVSTFTVDAANYLNVTHVSTGRGNNGGPIWVQNQSGDWSVAGIQSFSRPSEAGICAFSPATKTFMKAVAPLVADRRKSIATNKSLSTSTGRYAMPKTKKIPDGLHQWTKIPFNVNCFDDEEAKVVNLTLDLRITTQHRGDLMVAVQSPTGIIVVVDDGEGGPEDDLIMDNVSIKDKFSEELWQAIQSEKNGLWSILVQDRLKGDQCVVTQAELEIQVERFN